MAEDTLSLQQVQAAIRDANARWQASATSVSGLPRDQQVRRLGLLIPPGEMTLQEVEQRSQAMREQVLAQRAVGAPSSFDLRNVNGRNFITSVKNQGPCGSCVAFGVAATIEGTFRWQRQNPDLAEDRSEAHLFFCYAKSEGQSCSTGWWPENALRHCKETGVVDEDCFHYEARDQDCRLCGDWQSRALKIKDFHKIDNASQMKEWISTRGPLIGCMIVYEDFFNYRSGVYHHVTGGDVGGHCISIVGYDDGQGYWICKNSWGTGWGESGFFRIGYGECGIDSWLVYAVDGILETYWVRGVHVVGLWTVNQDRNAWAYLDGGQGWRKIAPDNDVIFYNFLAQLIAAKAANRPVDIFLDNGTIKQLYVF